MRRFRIAPVAGAMIFAAWVAAPAEAASPITRTALKGLFPGTFAVTMRGYEATFIAHGGGKLVGSSSGESDSGHWSIRGEKLCVMLEKWLGGETRCSAVVRDGEWFRANLIRFRKI